MSLNSAHPEELKGPGITRIEPLPHPAMLWKAQLRVGVQHPRQADALLGALSITSASVSTGGDYEHCFVHGGRRYHHVIDPRTGWPVEHTSSVTIMARTALEADALDTALFVMPPERAMAKARELGVAMLRTDPALHGEMTPAMRAVFEARAPMETPGLT